MKINDIVQVSITPDEQGAPTTHQLARVAYVDRDVNGNPYSIDVVYFYDNSRGKVQLSDHRYAVTVVESKPLFTDLDHRLSVIKRWQIAHTIQTQSVAEHIFNVERMALRIAMEWFHINVSEPCLLLDIMMLAHHHEDYEALSGDIPTMVKPYFNEHQFEKDHADILSRTSKPQVTSSFHTLAVGIVKLADMLEGYHFLCMEKALGNTYMDKHYEYESPRILKYVIDTWTGNERVYALAHQALSSIEYECMSERHSRRGR